MSDAERHQRALELFLAAAELGEDERSAFLARACGTDRELYEEVLELLAADVDASGAIPKEGSSPRERAEPGETPSSALVRELAEQRPRTPRYRLVGEIARGGMGVILKVWDKALGRQLAMKVVLGQAARGGDTPPVEERLLLRFLDEAKITGQLDHPGIVPVHELGVDDEGRVFFTMRLVKGRTLQAAFDALRAGEPEWSRTRLLNVLSKVCEAMAFAHEHGVVHRDLKPANVMVGRFGEVYVMDWGLGRSLGHEDAKDIRLVVPEGPPSTVLSAREASSQLVTRDGDVIGTPSYMAPEQARGELEAVGKRADVYSVGAILYDLLTGHPPYAESKSERPAPFVVYQALLHGPPPPIAPREAPPELIAICEKAMARDRAARYPDMQAMADDLRAFLEDRVVRAHRTGALVELRKWVRRNRVAAAGSAAAVMVVVLSSMLLGWQERRRARAVGTLYEERLAESVLARLDEPTPIHPDSVPALEALVGQAQELLERARQKREELALPPQRDELPENVEDLPYPLRVDRTYAAGFAEILEANRAELAKGGQDAAKRERLENDVAVLELEAPFRRRLFFEHLQEHRIRSILEREDEVGTRIVFLARLRAIERRLERARADLELARTLRARTLEEPAERWQACLDSIADRGECPQYEGLTLEPLLGLVPLRRDPRSGLWEFLHVLSGEAPEIGPDDRYVVRPETGIVLVLVPGDEGFVMGVEAERSVPRRDADPSCLPQEGPLLEVPLAPCLLSKYELTQAQWYRLAGDFPSEHFAGSQFDQYPRLPRTDPVESVSFERAQSWLRRWNLTIPTEAQWEHAARAGGAAPFGSSNDPASLHGRGNFGDLALLGFQATTGSNVPWDDGFPMHAPVGRFEPNPFGLHDVMGNVSEWTRDWSCLTLDPGVRVDRVVPETGELVPPYAHTRTFRGSSFKSTGDRLRISYRSQALPDWLGDGVGVRPSLDL